MIERKLLLGDEAIALGAIHAGISGVYAYPGTPRSSFLSIIVNLYHYNSICHSERNEV